MAPTETISCSVDKELVGTLIKCLITLEGVADTAATTPNADVATAAAPPKDGKKGRTKKGAAAEVVAPAPAPAPAVEINPTNINSVLNHILKVVHMLTKNVTSLKEEAAAREGGDGGVSPQMEERVRIQEDEVDECRQRGLKGNLILSSPTNWTTNKVTVIKTDDQLKQDKETLTSHILGLVNTKYGVNVPEGDVQALHRLPNGTVILRIWNRRPGSAWDRLLYAIKTGKNVGFHFFANFHLTRRRNGLLYEIRQLKKAGRIHKFYTDENGKISFRTKDKGDKHQVTYFSKDKHSLPITMKTKQDIVELLDQV